MVDNWTKRPASGLKRKPWILILEQNAYFYSNEAVKESCLTNLLPSVEDSVLLT